LAACGVPGNEYAREVQVSVLGSKSSKMINASGDVTECPWPAAGGFTEAPVFEIPYGESPRDEVSRNRVKLISAVRQSPKATV
jgi:hypothetical protein